MKKIIALLFFLLAAAAVSFVLVHRGQPTKLQPKVTNFAECAAAGYPVAQSYPRECTLPNGQFFVEQTVPGN